MILKVFIGLEAVILPLLGILNYLAFKNYWYWRFRWFDQPMHFLGGLALGLFGIIIYLYFFRNKTGTKKIDWKMMSMMSRKKTSKR